MGWAHKHIEDLKEGKEVRFRPRGNSMTGKVNDGQLVHVVPITNQELKNGDVVLCKVNGNYYLHLIKQIKPKQYLIGNNRGGINGWTHEKNIFGLLKSVSN